MKRQQKTIKQQFTYTGIGLHTGEEVTMTCKPLPVNQGIKFKRLDVKQQPEVEAVIDNVVSTQRCTVIGTEEWQINTVEHLLAALNACQIDNLLIELDAEEPPITDGSSKVFYRLIEEAGVTEQQAEKEIYKLREPIYIRDGEQYLVAAPDEEFKISYTFVSQHPGVSDQFAEFNFAADNYKTELAPARTFGFAQELKKLKRAGLALGGSLDNAVLIEEDGPVNKLRFPNELGRHKVLDVVGDMKLVPEFKGHIMAVRSGHKLNSVLAQKIKAKISREE